MVKGQLLTAAYIASGNNLSFVNELKEKIPNTHVTMKEYPYAKYTKYVSQSASTDGSGSTEHEYAKCEFVNALLIEKIECWFTTIEFENHVSVTFDGGITYENDKIPLDTTGVKDAMTGCTASLGNPYHADSEINMKIKSETKNTDFIKDFEDLLDKYAINKKEFFELFVYFLEDDNDTNTLNTLKYLNELIGDKYSFEISNEAKNFSVQAFSTEFWKSVIDAIEIGDQSNLDMVVKTIAKIYNDDGLINSSLGFFNYFGQDFVVDTTISDENLVIEDVETLKKAFAGYSGSSELIAHAQEFLNMQNTYHVNAIFAAAVSISETGGGRTGHAVDGLNNWFNMTGTDGPYITTQRTDENGNIITYHWRKYDTSSEGIDAFGKFISNEKSSYYFAAGNKTVASIGVHYCENAEQGWIPSTIGFMSQMYAAAGIDVFSNESFLNVAQNVWQQVCNSFTTYGGASVPPRGKTIDCSSYVSWVLYEYGYTEFGGSQKSSQTFLNTNWNSKYGWLEIPVKSGKNPSSILQPGDIFVRYGGDIHHVYIYVGPGKSYDCGDDSNWLGQNGQPCGWTDMLTGGRSKAPGKIIRVTKPE